MDMSTIQSPSLKQAAIVSLHHGSISSPAIAVECMPAMVQGCITVSITIDVTTLDKPEELDHWHAAICGTYSLEMPGSAMLANSMLLLLLLGLKVECQQAIECAARLARLFLG